MSAWKFRYNKPNAVKIRKVKENIEIGDENSNDKGVSPHLIHVPYPTLSPLRGKSVASPKLPRRVPTTG
jgi:hypothetical protein